MGLGLWEKGGRYWLRVLVVLVLLRRQRFQGGRNLLGARLVWVVCRSTVWYLLFLLLFPLHLRGHAVGIS